ncbi:MAG: hypothetical protein NT069_22065 [Planctomycetota bacterium]|nr:hypothetical protein [Planctomycetota bacterium]
MSAILVFEFVKSLAEFVSDGCQLVSRDQYAARLEACQGCEIRNGPVCDRERGGCGCRIALKAAAKTWECPHPLGSRWPAV